MDITMCKGHSTGFQTQCPLRRGCYRYTATPNEYRQSWFIEPPVLWKGGFPVCQSYWKIETDKGTFWE